MPSADFEPLRGILAARAERLHRLTNVVGTGIGNRRRGGEELDEPCLCVSVERKVAKEDLRDDEVIPAEVSVPGLGSAPTDVVETGRPQLVLDTTRYRPVRGGCMIQSDGTLGGIAFDADALEPAFVTCWHCLFFPSFWARVGSRFVWQTGFGRNDLMGEARDAAPMLFGQLFDLTGPGYSQHPLNAVDAAKGDFRYLVEPKVAFNVVGIGSAIFELRWASQGELVQKRGQWTGLTKGRVVETDCTVVDLNYGGGSGSGFYASVGGPGSGCVKIESEDGNPFVGLGDSGSVVFSQERGVVSSAYPAVGILFAETGNDPSRFGYACGINAAFSSLSLITVCRGIYLQALKQAAVRKAIFGPVRGGGFEASFGGIADAMKRFDELRDYARDASEPGRALIDVATAAIPQIADPVYRDPIAFGLYVRLMERFALQPTVLDIFETKIDGEAIDLFRRLLARLERVEPASRDAVSEVANALADVQDRQVADLLEVDVG